MFNINSLSSYEQVDQLAQQIFKQIQDRMDVDSDAYKELVRHYKTLRELRKILFKEKLEQESSFRIIPVN
ncbi:MAG TPA: hypothetical protein PLT92_13515 [Ignavibacteriaceae bacterium]|nr:hypothetical protein [Ignavibacteriaceae bacterium]